MSITSANIQFTLTIPGVYSTAQLIQGYAEDDVTEFENQTIAQAMMGVDGNLTAGYINVPWVQAFTLMADSPSMVIIDTWAMASKALQDVYPASGLIVYPSLGQKYPLSKGFLTQYRPVPPGKKILQPRAFQITWNLGAPQPI